MPWFASTEDINVAISLCREIVKGKHYSVNNGIGRVKLIIPGTTKSSYIFVGTMNLEDGETTYQGEMCMVKGELIKPLVQHFDVFITIQELAFMMLVTTVSVILSTKKLACLPTDQGCAGV